MTTAGSLDASFGLNGQVQIIQGFRNFVTSAELLDTKILISMNHYSTTNNWSFFPAIACINSDGTLDTGFGTNGIAFVPTEINNTRKVLSYNNSYIFLIGQMTAPYRIIIWRFLFNGTLDTTYGSGGSVIIELTTNTSLSGEMNNNGAVIQGNKIVITCKLATTFLTLRLNLDGTLDTSFGIGGIATYTFTVATQSYNCNSVAIGPGDNIFVSGSYGNYTSSRTWITLKYDSNGILDPNFGDGGNKNITFSGLENNQLNSSIVNSAGNIILGGSSNGYAALVQLSPTGNVIYQVVNTTSSGSNILSMVLQPDDKIITSGQLGLSRYNSNGILDSTFGVGGIVNYNTYNITQFNTVLQRRSDLKILVVASTWVSGHPHIGITRFIGFSKTTPSVISSIPSTKIFGEESFSLANLISTNSDSAISFSSSNIDVISVLNNIASINAVGTANLTLSLAETSAFSPFSATYTIQVTPSTQSNPIPVNTSETLLKLTNATSSTKSHAKLGGDINLPENTKKLSNKASQSEVRITASPRSSPIKIYRDIS
jgi:uncharacterized delta-60 repeat protein